MIAELDQILYKNVCAEQRDEGQRNDVSGNSYQGFDGILHPTDRMLVKLAATHKGAFQ